MRKFFLLFTIALFCFSCSNQSYVNCFNRYKNFDSFYNSIIYSRSNNDYSFYKDWLTSLNNCYVVDDWNRTYYSQGICEHGSEHIEYDSVCPTLHWATPILFFDKASYAINIDFTFFNETDVQNKPVIGIENVGNFIYTVFDLYSKHKFPEMRLMGYDFSKDGTTNFIERCFVLKTIKNNMAGIIVYSSNFEVDQIASINLTFQTTLNN